VLELSAGDLARGSPAEGRLSTGPDLELAKTAASIDSDHQAYRLDAGNDHAQCKDFHLASGSVPVETGRSFSQINVDEVVSYFKQS